MSQSNIFPSKINIDKKVKENRFQQRAIVIWFTGLSSAGKTTLAQALEKQLFEKGYIIQMLDGDNVRDGINSDLGFALNDRKENIRRVSEIAKLFVDSGIITICSFISPTFEIREMSKKIIGRENFFEVFVNTSLEICAKRDTKGLYKKAFNGEIECFTGVSSPFDIPKDCDIEVRTDLYNVDELISQIMHRIKGII